MAIWSKNEPVASRRRCDLIIYQDGATSPAPVNTSFSGKIYIDSVNHPHYTAATGTLTNKRIPLSLATDTVDAVDATLNTITFTGHAFQMADLVQFSGGTPPPPLVTGTDYYFYVVDANTIKVATTLANLIAGVFVDITGAGSGTRNVITTASSTRAMPGLYTYEAAQLETDVDVAEISVMIEGTGYSRANSGGAYTLVHMTDQASAFDADCEGATSYGDVLRLIFAVICGKVTNYTTGTYAFRDPTTGTKIRVTFTTDASGRLTVTFGDLTP